MKILFDSHLKVLKFSSKNSRNLWVWFYFKLEIFSLKCSVHIKSVELRFPSFYHLLWSNSISVPRSKAVVKFIKMTVCVVCNKEQAVRLRIIFCHSFHSVLLCWLIPQSERVNLPVKSLTKTSQAQAAQSSKQFLSEVSSKSSKTTLSYRKHTFNGHCLLWLV